MGTYTGADKRLQYLFQNGGGGGSSTLAGLTDVDLTSPTDGQVLKYDANNDEWINANESGGGGAEHYNPDTTQAIVIGTVGTKTLYRRYFEGTIPSSGNNMVIFNNYDNSNNTLLNAYGEVKKGTNLMQIGAMLYGYTDSWFSAIMIMGTDLKLWFGTTFRGGTYKVWVEYYA